MKPAVGYHTDDPRILEDQLSLYGRVSHLIFPIKVSLVTTKVIVDKVKLTICICRELKFHSIGMV